MYTRQPVEALKSKGYISHTSGNASSSLFHILKAIQIQCRLLFPPYVYWMQLSICFIYTIFLNPHNYSVSSMVSPQFPYADVEV